MHLIVFVFNRLELSQLQHRLLLVERRQSMLLRQKVPVDILDITCVRFGLLSVDSRADPPLVELAA